MSTKAKRINRLHLSIAALCVGFTPLIAQDTVHLPVGSNFSDSVNAYPGNTIFIVKAGLHRGQHVTMKSGTTFIGEDGAIINGSRILSDWSPSGDYWVHGGQTPYSGEMVGACSGGAGITRGSDCSTPYASDDETCKHPDDLFIDGAWMRHVASLNDIADDSCWYFDYAGGNIYTRINPSGRTIELSYVQSAFAGSNVQDITISNLVIENYASQYPEYAAIIETAHQNDVSSSSNWLIEDCEVRNNHLSGIWLSGSHHILRNNFLHDNGLDGCGMSNVVGAQIENNELSYNNRARFAINWEGGGCKILDSDTLVFRGNYAHHNLGAGLWTDHDNYNVLYEGNVCEYNSMEGIFHEVSGNAIIRCNISRFNGWGWACWLTGAQIGISISCNTEVYNNYVETSADYGQGILLRQQGPRSDCYIMNNDYIHHNIIVMRGDGDQWSMGTNGVDCDVDYVYEQVWSSNLLFDYNQYHVANLGGSYWRWDKPPYEDLTFAPLWDWTGFQGLGQEEHGTIDDNLSIKVDLPSDCGDISAIGAPPRIDPGEQVRRPVIINFDMQSRRLSVVLSEPLPGASLTLYDALGHRIKAAKYPAGENTIVYMHGFRPGVYFVKLTAGNFSRVMRVVVNR